jgi:predicted dehydrogenase
LETKNKYSELKFLVVGLGSMGKRRIRNLKKLEINNIDCFDLRSDRIEETKSKYGITVIEDVEEAISKNNYQAIIISVPPAQHHLYIKIALKYSLHFFVEASVLDTGIQEAIEEIKTKKIVAGPSSTLFFHPAVKIISELISQNAIGKISHATYHSGQYLPDWHTYESVSDYYVSHKETGGAREIVPFELTWLTKLFGWPQFVMGINAKTINIPGAETIDDTYQILLHGENYNLSLTVDTVSRYAMRNLLINGSEGIINWTWENNYVKIFSASNNEWNKVEFKKENAQPGYNENIIENMYVEELQQFIDTTLGSSTFFNTMEYDFMILQLLYTIEKSWRTKTILPCDKTSLINHR